MLSSVECACIQFQAFFAVLHRSLAMVFIFSERQPICFEGSQTVGSVFVKYALSGKMFQ
jgi:hypothetical protein